MGRYHNVCFGIVVWVAVIIGVYFMFNIYMSGGGGYGVFYE